MQFKLHVLEDELSESKLETSRSNAETIAIQSNYEIQVAELKSRINEMEEEQLIESGRARIAGEKKETELDEAML